MLARDPRDKKARAYVCAVILNLNFCLVLQFTPNRNLNSGKPTAEGEYSADCLFVPKVTVRVPSAPAFLKGLVNKFNKLWEKVFKKFRKWCTS